MQNVLIFIIALVLARITCNYVLPLLLLPITNVLNKKYKTNYDYNKNN